MTKDEINTKYLKLHDKLGSRVTYKWLFPKDDAKHREEFDIVHAKIWADCDDELKARKKELKDKPSKTKEETPELAELTDMFPELGPPVRDLAKEIDDLKDRVDKLEK